MNNIKLKVIYEDNHLLVIEKPANVLSQEDITGDIDITKIAKQYLKEKYNKPGNVYLGLVHRLDRRVGGVMILAKTSKAATRLSIDIQNRNIKKIYLAKVRGKLANEGSINTKILKDQKKKVAIISEQGKSASLSYQTIGYDNNQSFAIVSLHTGRYNQIRVSFAHINHPIVGDYKYKDLEASKNDDLGLWCYKMSITHPTLKKEMVFESRPEGLLWEGVSYGNFKKL